MSQYRTGTVAVTNANNSVVGTGTLFLANVAVGSLFSVAGSSVPYVVGAVPDDTHLTLTTNYAGTTLSGLAYAVTTSFTPNLSLPYMEQRDVDTQTIFKRAMVLLDTLLGGLLTAAVALAVKGTIQPKRVPSADWGVDFAARGTEAMATNATYDLAVGSGLVVIHDATNGEAAVFLCYGAATVTKIAGGASIVSGSPSASHIGLYYNSGKYRIENKWAGSRDVGITTIKTLTAS